MDERDFSSPVCFLDFDHVHPVKQEQTDIIPKPASASASSSRGQDEPPLRPNLRAQSVECLQSSDGPQTSTKLNPSASDGAGDKK